ncbi:MULTISPECIES: hypothetical protein [unclassified Arcicella]|uniref:hypothetical protein n=1 Tax=unclassified Arcicella TaxID=2644986 RepID=UPI00285A3F2B|nr:MULTISPECIES: hypothetical protein [unclassified Arcicella]MDR6561561.1 hypothetical protein [Arcicella sp. BE51]MDR6811445.1 hypothetical protein [Arcicella sp. BE140]MDR6822795.1 hypothetical protein [Arcicella sp. BE139]
MRNILLIYLLDSFLIIQIIILNTIPVSSQIGKERVDCQLVSIAFETGISKFHSYLKSDTIYFENTIGLCKDCIERSRFKFLIVNFNYLDNDTTLFLKPQLVIGLNYYNSKSKLVRMGLHKIQYKHETDGWEVALEGNIEIYFDKNKNSKRIKKIIRNL